MEDPAGKFANFPSFEVVRMLSWLERHDAGVPIAQNAFGQMGTDEACTSGHQSKHQCSRRWRVPNRRMAR
jgi:hypothetical protein